MPKTLESAYYIVVADGTSNADGSIDRKVTENTDPKNLSMQVALLAMADLPDATCACKRPTHMRRSPPG